MSEFLYAMDNAEDLVKVGYTTDPKRRIRAHRLNGFQLIAIWPGTHDDEQALHDILAPSRATGRGREIYVGDETLYEWLSWLLLRRYAVDNEEDARHLSRLPLEVWKPGDNRHPVDPNGQLTILSGLPPRERPRYVSDLAHLSSESDEWFTPSEVIELARLAMGSIDTDPASCIEANKTVRADLWYSKELNGLDPHHPWRGNVWLNPPYGRVETGAAAFIRRLLDELGGGNIDQAITCLNLNSMSAMWFDDVYEHAAQHCIWRGRVNFTPPGGAEGSSPTKGTVLSYFGDNPEGFSSRFGEVGHILEMVK